jgi:hypothetical protein
MKAAAHTVDDTNDPVKLFEQANLMQSSNGNRVIAAANGQPIIGNMPINQGELVLSTDDGVNEDVFENSDNKTFAEVVRYLLLDPEEKDIAKRKKDADEIFEKLEIMANNCNVPLLRVLPDSIETALKREIFSFEELAPKRRKDVDDRRDTRDYRLLVEVFDKDIAHRIIDRARGFEVSNRDALRCGILHCLKKDKKNVAIFNV